jgi:hypothetical protein
MVSYGGAASYVQVNAATTLLDEMQFGDINGDGTTDVFTTVPNTGLPGPGSYDWLYSPSATGAFQRTMVTLYTVHDVRLAGDFNGDHRSDWFFTTPKSAGLLQWWYEFYTGGAPPFGANMLAFDSTPADRLRFGDFDGDGITDVFTVVRSGDACVAPTTGLHTIAPCRLFDTRNDTGPDSASPILAAGEIRPMSLGGRCGIPDTAQTISVNVTVTGAGAAGDFTLHRADLSTAPVTANLSFGPGQTRASNGMLELDLNGGETFKVVNRSSAPAHFILDVNGYFM